MKIENKSFPAIVLKTDKELGIVDAIVAVMGNIDHGDDIIHPGAFTKTIVERSGKIKVLDNHNMNSVRDVIGKCLEIKEVSKTELPEYIVKNFPDANGGLFTKTQYLLDTPEGLGAFKRIDAGAIDEYSIAFSIPKSKYDYENIETGGQKTQVRNIREVKLYEYSPVILGMNSATTTISSKSHEVKELSLYQIECAVMDGFNKLFMNPSGEVDEYGFQEFAGYRACDIYENYLLAKPYNLESEYQYYRVSYTHNDDYSELNFNTPEDWQGGNFQFVAGAKYQFWADESEFKAGRMISTANLSKIQAALDALTELVNAASQDSLDNSDNNMSNTDKSNNIADSDNNPVITPITSTLELEKQKYLLYLDINRNKN